MLEITGLSVAYGHIHAVNGLDLRVEEGEIVALVGPNGAGKTSTMMAISGLVPTNAGRIVFQGEIINRIKPNEVYRRGVVQVPEGRLIFGEMTVRENLLLGGDVLGNSGQAATDLDRVSELFPLLEERKDHRADTLSGGQQQMLAIARGLMGQPKLLLLDEPSLGLAPKVVEDMFSMIGKLNEMGMTILIVEQNLHQALHFADRAYLLEAGCLIDHGSAYEFMKSDYIMQSYLGVGSGRTETPNTA